MRVSVYWDSVEEGLARLLLLDGEKTVIWPSSCLPSEARVGEWLSFEILSDVEKQESVMLENERLRQEILERKYEDN